MIYRREEFIQEDPEDRKFPVKTIELLSATDGSSNRFVGRVSIGLQTPMGATTLPVSFEIEAKTIEEAFSKFEVQAEAEVERARGELQDQLQKMRHQAQGRIVTPGQIAPSDLGKLKL